MKILKPTVHAKKQSQTTLPPNNDDTIMDDTTVLMDGDGLMGGKTSVHSNISVKINLPRYFSKIRKRR